MNREFHYAFPMTSFTSFLSFPLAVSDASAREVDGGGPIRVEDLIPDGYDKLRSPRNESNDTTWS